MDYVQCRVTFPDDNSVRYWDSYERAAEGRIKPDDLRDRTIKFLNDLVSDKPELCGEYQLRLLGEHLYRLVFDVIPLHPEGTTPGQQFDETYKQFLQEIEIKKRSVRVRLTLVFYKEASKLASYPWELLYMPRQPEGLFLAGAKTELILTRYIQEVGDKSRVEETRKLRILVAVADPRGKKWTPIDPKHEVINGIKALSAKNIEVKPIEVARVGNVGEAISKWRPDIVHFIGHGIPGKMVFIEEEETLRGLEAEFGSGGFDIDRPADIPTIKGLFAEHKPRLVFLHACEGAAGTSLESFQSIAHELVVSGIPSVIAMQYQIKDEDAKIFAAKFYEALGAGASVGEAVSKGRNALAYSPVRATFGDRSFGTPVVYVQEKQETPIIIPPPTVEAAGDDGAYKSPCPGCGTILYHPMARCSRGHLVKWCPNCHQANFRDQDICVYCEQPFSSETTGPRSGSSSRADAVSNLDKPDTRSPQLGASQQASEAPQSNSGGLG